MTLQNRVDPWGRLIAVPARGTWLGNRGILHNENKQIVAPWRHKAWVTCRLDFNGIRRPIFSPNTYSELFFLDEATALAAGHRPCGTCRRERYKEFKALWCAANSDLASSDSVSIADIDRQLHSERAGHEGKKVTFAAAYQDVPPGAVIEIDGCAYLLWKGMLHGWTAEGYRRADIRPNPQTLITVLTPASIVKMLRAGFVPEVHASIAQAS